LQNSSFSLGYSIKADEHQQNSNRTAILNGIYNNVCVIYHVIQHPRRNIFESGRRIAPR